MHTLTVKAADQILTDRTSEFNMELFVVDPIANVGEEEEVVEEEELNDKCLAKDLLLKPI